jgi:hypothetical protein
MYQQGKKNPQWYISGKIFVIVDVLVRKIIFLDDIYTTKKFHQQCSRGEKYFLQQYIGEKYFSSVVYQWRKIFSSPMYRKRKYFFLAIYQREKIFYQQHMVFHCEKTFYMVKCWAKIFHGGTLVRREITSSDEEYISSIKDYFGK